MSWERSCAAGDKSRQELAATASLLSHAHTPLVYTETLTYLFLAYHTGNFMFLHIYIYVYLISVFT